MIEVGIHIYIYIYIIIYWLAYEGIPVCNFTTSLTCASKVSGQLSVVLLLYIL